MAYCPKCGKPVSVRDTYCKSCGKRLDKREAPQANDVDNPAKCSCGQVIPSRHLRDFYLHVLECHPDAHVMGVPCSFCKQLIPFGLGACHEVLEHNINPPLQGAIHGDLQKDFEVLQKVRRARIKIVLPKQ